LLLIISYHDWCESAFSIIAVLKQRGLFAMPGLPSPLVKPVMHEKNSVLSSAMKDGSNDGRTEENPFS
jgi:hypothetical protein